MIKVRGTLGSGWVGGGGHWKTWQGLRRCLWQSWMCLNKSERQIGSTKKVIKIIRDERL